MNSQKQGSTVNDNHNCSTDDILQMNQDPSTQNLNKSQLLNYLERINSLFKSDIKNINATYSDLNQVLQTACNEGFHEVVQSVVNIDNAVSKKNKIDIFNAVNRNEQKTSLKIDPEVENQCCTEKLCYYDALRILVQTRKDVSENPMIDYYQNTEVDHLKCAEILLNDVEFDKLDVNRRDHNLNTLLHLAGDYNDIDMVKLLIKNGAYIGYPNKYWGLIPPQYMLYNGAFDQSLNACIWDNGKNPFNRDYVLTYDYTFLAPPKTAHCRVKSNEIDHVLNSFVNRGSENQLIVDEKDKEQLIDLLIMNSISEHSTEIDLLTHPAKLSAPEHRIKFIDEESCMNIPAGKLASEYPITSDIGMQPLRFPGDPPASEQKTQSRDQGNQLPDLSARGLEENKGHQFVHVTENPAMDVDSHIKTTNREQLTNLLKTPMECPVKSNKHQLMDDPAKPTFNNRMQNSGENTLVNRSEKPALHCQRILDCDQEQLVNVSGNVGPQLQIKGATGEQLMDLSMHQRRFEGRAHSKDIVAEPRKDYKIKASEEKLTNPAHTNAGISAVNNVQKSQILLETSPIVVISEIEELKSNLLHPIIVSYLNMKWYKMRYFVWANRAFYLSFCLSLTGYILYKHEHAIDGDQMEQNDSAGCFYGPVLWALLFVLWSMLVLRELLQIIIDKREYILGFENVLELIVIVCTSTILFCIPDCNTENTGIVATVVLVAWTEWMLMIGSSINVEMFKVVLLRFLKLILLYSNLIVAFSISFYLLFKTPQGGANHTWTNKTKQQNFKDPKLSIFKSFVMFAGELDTANLPFERNPIFSHAIFLAFVFTMVLVLANLLNGLAVGDTRKLQKDAEMIQMTYLCRMIKLGENMAVAFDTPYFYITSIIRWIKGVCGGRIHSEPIQMFHERFNLFTAGKNKYQIMVMRDSKSPPLDGNASLRNLIKLDASAMKIIFHKELINKSIEMLQNEGNAIKVKNKCRIMVKRDWELLSGQGNEPQNLIELDSYTSRKISHNHMINKSIDLLQKKGGAIKIHTERIVEQKPHDVLRKVESRLKMQRTSRSVDN